MSTQEIPHYGILVAELQDVVPRRNPSLPNLYVGITTMNLLERFEHLEKGKGSPWLKNNLTSLREDLSIEPGMERHDEARKLKKQLVDSLKSEGYTVNRNTDIWTVYVVELHSTAIKNPGEGYVYVGETRKTPEERFCEHMSRARNGKIKLFSSVVAEHGKQLRMDLAPGVQCFDELSSKKAEAEWAGYLRFLGYTVEGGH
jgi:hypothetical protein